jgi:hypothetical protein
VSHLGAKTGRLIVRRSLEISSFEIIFVVSSILLRNLINLKNSRGQFVILLAACDPRDIAVFREAERAEQGC